MKNRLIMLTFAACMVSSLAFADNPADAPLVNDDASGVAVQQNQAATHHMRCGKKHQPHTQAKTEQAEKAIATGKSPGRFRP